MRQQSRKPFDESTIPNDLCPIATEYSQLKTGDWRAERPKVDRDKCVKCAKVEGVEGEDQMISRLKVKG